MKFNNFWTEACKAMIDHDLQEPTLSRSRRPPQRIAEGSSSGDAFSDAKQSFRVTYYEFLDVLVEELNSRFKDQEVSTLISMEHIFMGAYSDTEPSEDSLKKLAAFYQSDIDEGHLRNELKDFYTFVKWHVSALPRDPIVQLAQLLVQSGLSVFPQVASPALKAIFSSSSVLLFSRTVIFFFTSFEDMATKHNGTKQAL